MRRLRSGRFVELGLVCLGHLCELDPSTNFLQSTLLFFSSFGVHLFLLPSFFFCCCQVLRREPDTVVVWLRRFPVAGHAHINIHAMQHATCISFFLHCFLRPSRSV